MKRVMLSVVVIALLGGASAGHCQWHSPRPPRIEKRLSFDSTLLFLSIDSKTRPRAGQTFKAKIHVTPRNDFRVFSAGMSGCCCPTPLSVALPQQLDSFFEIVDLKESGNLLEGYDSNFQAVTSLYSTPFDAIVTVRVKENSVTPIPFYVLVHFQATTATQCMPPRTFAVPMEVLGEKPIEIKIAHGKVSKPKKAAATRATNAQSSLMKDFEPFGVTTNSKNNFWDRMSVLNVGRDAS